MGSYLTAFLCHVYPCHSLRWGRTTFAVEMITVIAGDDLNIHGNEA
jgi:hypothetical protein